MRVSAARLLVHLSLLVCLLTPTLAAAQAPEASPTGGPARPSTSPSIFTMADLDLTTAPGDDFYQFAAGGWMERTHPSPDHVWVAALDDQASTVNAQVDRVIAATEPDPTTDAGKARILYDQVLDMAARDAAGIDPIRPLLNEIATIIDIETGLAFHQTAQTRWWLAGPFEASADPSPVDPTTYAAGVSGVWLPVDIGVLLDDSEDGLATRAAWLEATAAILIEMEFDAAEAERIANGAWAWYASLAAIATEDIWSDPALRNNPRTRADLQAMLPQFDWDAWLASVGWESAESFNVDDIAYMNGLAGVLAEADPLALHDAFLAEIVWSFRELLTSRIEEIAFSFEGTFLYGIETMDPLEARAQQIMSGLMQDAIGAAWAEEYFPEATKDAALEIVDAIVAQFRIAIENSPWLSDEGKANALLRLDTLGINLAYPDEWQTYDDFVIGDNLFQTALNGRLRENAGQLALADTTVVPNYWWGPIYWTYNWLGQAENAFTISAAALTAPAFNPNDDLAVTYGNLGVVVAQLIAGTLQIDGVVYDAAGNRTSWYTEEDAAAYQALQEQVGEFISGIEVFPGLFGNGDQQQISTTWLFSGAAIAFRALEAALEADPGIATEWFLTPQQRFCVAMANRFKGVMTEEMQDVAVNYQFWPAPPLAAVQPLRQLQGFYDAFHIGPDDPEFLAPEARITIW